MWTWLMIIGFLSGILFIIILGVVGDELDDDSIIGYVLIGLIILGFIASFTGLAGFLVSSACNSDDRLIKEKAEIVEQLETVKSKELLDVVVKEAYDWNKDHTDNEELIIDIDNILLDRENKK